MFAKLKDYEQLVMEKDEDLLHHRSKLAEQ